MTGKQGGNWVICTYRVKEGDEGRFVELLERHWPALHEQGLVTDEPSRAFRGKDESGKTYFVELFEWKDITAADTAHHNPGVMAVWEPMGMLVEGRLGRPPMEFPHFEQVQLDYAKA